MSLNYTFVIKTDANGVTINLTPSKRDSGVRFV